MNVAHPLLEVYPRLYQHYGPQGWWPGEGPLDVVIGAILTQAAAWRNVELALRNLKAANCWSLEAIRQLPPDDLAAIIRPSGYFNAKARKLQAFANHVHHHHGGDLAAFLNQDAGALREELLSIHGIGPETADDIVLYAAGQPSFVIDAYTRRILGRLGLAPANPKAGYAEYQSLFHRSLPPDAGLFNEYHALLDRHAKERCGKTPRCAGCCLREVCSTGQRSDALTLQD
ncbi:MAG: endonuclease [Dehalococcoidia bacterium]|nr:endonuclease [Dehalococcoidia bacterium]MSQ17022.1 endonuclease [Dehalococcoidia bacterium]